MSYYEPYDPDTQAPVNVIYLFARTHSALELEDAALESIRQHLPVYSGLLFQFDEEGETWTDGFVFKTYTEQTPAEFALSAAGALGKLAAWTIYSPTAEQIEFPPAGPITRLVEKLESGDLNLTRSLLFLKGSASTEALEEELTHEYYGRRCVPIFQFRDGVQVSRTPVAVL